jgi:hypothetical protein
MNPTAVNPQDSQVHGSEAMSRSVFGAPLPAQPPTPQAPNQASPAPVQTPPATAPMSTSQQAAMTADSAVNHQAISHNDVSNTTMNTTAEAHETTDKEWVESAKNVVNTTSGNPFEKSQKLAALRVQYLATKFGKNPDGNEQKI